MSLITREVTTVGLALRGKKSQYLFGLAGTKYRCQAGTLFYFGIGGHIEPNEDWLQCAHREAREEIGASVSIISAPTTWLVKRCEQIVRVDFSSIPKPLAIYEMPGYPSATQQSSPFNIAVFDAQLTHRTDIMVKVDEVQGVISLPRSLIVEGVQRKFTVEEMLTRGGSVLVGIDKIDLKTQLYPIGTAVALGCILRHKRSV